ncbi:MAG TPA: HAMP domain-containing sensor histidine kinase [Candidatus Limnocylindrales bacterium]|nr:HAMP domain-containing sensor histidine kinase [Candidatus Limnocylindrales bacterium]
MVIDRWGWPLRRFAWIDAAWAAFALLNLAGILAFGDWETVPFHFIWVSLTILYGFRVWSVGPTLSILVVICVLTGSAILVDVLRGMQPVDELTEVPLMTAMFLAMVWHARRRVTALREIARVSEANLRLLERQRRFVQDASHQLRTPIAIASAHAELVARETQGVIAADLGVVVDELKRLGRLADGLLLLVAAEDPHFLHRAPVEVEPLLVETLRRWSATPRLWRLGIVDEAVVDGDAERLTMAIDALVENAVKHTSAGEPIELSVREDGATVVIGIRDSGRGIPLEDQERIFARFAQAGPSAVRHGGVGLGLPIVKAVIEAHGGAVRLYSVVGEGTTFELVLPAMGSPTPKRTPLPTVTATAVPASPMARD